MGGPMRSRDDCLDVGLKFLKALKAFYHYAWTARAGLELESGLEFGAGLGLGLRIGLGLGLELGLGLKPDQAIFADPLYMAKYSAWHDALYMGLYTILHRVIRSEVRWRMVFDWSWVGLNDVWCCRVCKAVTRFTHYFFYFYFFKTLFSWKQWWKVASLQTFLVKNFSVILANILFGALGIVILRGTW